MIISNFRKAWNINSKKKTKKKNLGKNIDLKQQYNQKTAIWTV